MPTLVLIKVIYHPQNNERKKRIMMSSFLSHLKNHYRSFAYCIVINTLGLGNWSEYCGLVMGPGLRADRKRLSQLLPARREEGNVSGVCA